ncbi:hypothetical protein E2C01_015072 [Portunus trituberculatus]|uniref:Uncharacterized protein n=1 Tax=Portunus trituberculatus TaxID=210409 RepID=A0A5B7DLK4_PORTR|nr:hypothetical protein [Portunus trituberculatus]
MFFYVPRVLSRSGEGAYRCQHRAGCGCLAHHSIRIVIWLSTVLGTQFSYLWRPAAGGGEAEGSEASVTRATTLRPPCYRPLSFPCFRNICVAGFWVSLINNRGLVRLAARDTPGRCFHATCQRDGLNAALTPTPPWLYQQCVFSAIMKGVTAPTQWK